MEIRRRTLFSLVAAGTIASSALPDLALGDGTAQCRIIGPVNGGFEEPTDGAIPGWHQRHGSGGFEVGTARVSEGRQALHVLNQSGVISLVAERVAVTPRMYYSVTAQASWRSGRMQMYLYFHDAKGKLIQQTNRIFEVPEADEWYCLGMGDHAPEGAATLEVMLYSPRPQADFWVDDVTIVETHARIERFDVASKDLSIIGMTVAGDKAYVVTRNQRPAVLGAYDIAAGRLTGRWELPGGDSAWAITHDERFVYVLAHLGGHLYRLEMSSGKLTVFPTFGPSDLTAFGLVKAENGMLYACTHPDAGVWEISPETGQAQRRWQVGQGELYARSITAEGNTVVVGTSPAGGLYRLDVVTGEVREITPEGAPDKGWVSVVLRGGIVYACSGPDVYRLDESGRVTGRWILQGSQIDTLRALEDGSVWATLRPTGGVFRLSAEADQFDLLGIPADGQEHREIVQSGERVIGQAGDGTIWIWDGQKFNTHHLQNTEMAGPTLVQDMVVLPNGRAVTSASSITVHEVGKRVIANIPIAAVPIRLAYARGKLYAFTYPRTEIIEITQDSWRAEIVGKIGKGQMRPWAVHFDKSEHSMVIGTEGASSGPGALSKFDVRRHTLRTWVGICGNRAITATTLAQGRTFIAAGLNNSGLPAQIAEVDIRTGDVLWTAEPYPELRTIESIAMDGDVLYGVVRGNRWFAYDVRRHVFLRRGWLSGTHSYGHIQVHHGRVIVPTFKGMVFELSLTGRDSRIIVDGFADGWRRGPKLFFDKKGNTALGLADMRLARFDLDPCHLCSDSQ